MRCGDNIGNTGLAGTNCWAGFFGCRFGREERVRDWWEVEGRVRVWYNVGVRVFALRGR